MMHHPFCLSLVIVLLLVLAGKCVTSEEKQAYLGQGDKKQIQATTYLEQSRFASRGKRRGKKRFRDSGGGGGTTEDHDNGQSNLSK